MKPTDINELKKLLKRLESLETLDLYENPAREFLTPKKEDFTKTITDGFKLLASVLSSNTNTTSLIDAQQQPMPPLVVPHTETIPPVSQNIGAIYPYPIPPFPSSVISDEEFKQRTACNTFNSYYKNILNELNVKNNKLDIQLVQFLHYFFKVICEIHVNVTWKTSKVSYSRADVFAALVCAPNKVFKNDTLALYFFKRFIKTLKTPREACSLHVFMQFLTLNIQKTAYIQNPSKEVLHRDIYPLIDELLRWLKDKYYLIQE